MRLPAELLDRRDIIACGDEAFGQLGDLSQLVARALEVLAPYSGREPEVVDLAHGLQDITSLFLGLMIEHPNPLPAHSVGLCATCRWVGIVTNRRGSVFYRCARADVDPRFVRYPPLPVLACPGYEPQDLRGAGP